MLDSYKGKAGAAGKIRLDNLNRPDQQATLAAWLINAPGQSPAWSDYMVGIIHLRDIPGVKPASINRPGATHELLICALDPAENPDPGDIETIVPLSPINAAVQFTGNSDEQAIHIGEQATRAICDGYMPAEPALSGQGQQIWTDAVDATIEHLKRGYHR